MHFGAALRIFRTDAGLSLRRLAEQVGVSNAYLSRIENGHDAPPTPDRLVAIARALGLPPSLLLELAHKINPNIAGYLERVPTAAELFLDVARRGLTAAQLARVKAFIDAEFPAPYVESREPRLSALLAPERIILGLSCTHLEDAIDVASTRLAASDRGPNGRELASAILRREQDSPTTLGGGIAAPHAIDPRVAPRAVLLTLATPLSTATPDGVPLQLLFVAVHPEGGRDLLLVLGQVARLAGSGFIGDLINTHSPEKALRQLEALHL
jgi:PTS system nitrogen regulatory IIA component